MQYSSCQLRAIRMIHRSLLSVTLSFLGDAANCTPLLALTESSGDNILAVVRLKS